MSAAEHEARIDRMQAAMLGAPTASLRREWQSLFLAAIRERNAQRTPEQVAQIELERGLR